MGEALKGFSRFGSKALLFAIASQAALVADLEAAGRIRRGLRGRSLEDVGEGFAWRKREEVELESGGARVKLYTRGEELYEEMIEEIGRVRVGVKVGSRVHG